MITVCLDLPCANIASFNPHQNAGPSLGWFVGSIHDQCLQPTQLFHQGTEMEREGKKVQFQEHVWSVKITK